MGILISEEMFQNSNERDFLILTGGQEVSDIPLEEDFESVDKDEDNVPETTPVRDKWLEAVVVDIRFEIKSLGKHSLA